MEVSNINNITIEIFQEATPNEYLLKILHQKDCINQPPMINSKTIQQWKGLLFYFKIKMHLILLLN